MKYKTLHFHCGKTPEARKIYQRLTDLYGQHPKEDADILVALGGDGTMLHVLRENMHTAKPIFGLNRGSVGFLMNEYREEDLLERINAAHAEQIHPLRMCAVSQNQKIIQAIAINEVTVFRQSYQAAKIKITVDGKTRIEELTCDGVIVATPAGSTAYNLSAQGPILPIMAPLLALTPVSPFRPRSWRGALLPNTAHIRFDVLDSKKRPVNAAADNAEMKSVRSVTISCATDITATILFDQSHSWEEKILREQFRHC